MKTGTESQQYTVAIFWFFLLCTSGCVSIEKQAGKYQRLELKKYVIVHPEGRRSTPEYQEFALWKTQQGYTVEWISFDPKASPQERFISVSQQLKVAHPGTGQSAYLLIAASQEELPMGPWQISGTDLTIASDLPLMAGREELGGRIAPKDWKPALDFPPTWICGRIPYQHPEVVATSLRSARIFHENVKPVSALLGTERFAISNDSSMIMAGVRDDLKDLNWKTYLFNQDWPRDQKIDDKTVNVTATKTEGNQKTISKFDIEWSFISSWNFNSPDIVYIISHSSKGSGKDDIQFIGAGNQLFHPQAFLLWNDPKFNTRHEQRSPATPAVFLTTGCTMGTPNNSMLNLMAREGWTAAILTSTHDTAPLPLFAAIRAERAAPLYFAENLTVGQSIHATLNAYLKDSKWDPVNWLLYPWVKNAKLQNVLGVTIYGDPSISLENRTRLKKPLSSFDESKN